MSEHDNQEHRPQQDPQVEQETAAPAQQGPQASCPSAILGEHATGDIVIDSALQDLHDAPADDLDAQIEAGRRVQQTLQARLGDLGE
ncbi:MAG TPA: hypothetical protein VGK60_00510 [Pedococcus sp.]